MGEYCTVHLYGIIVLCMAEGRIMVGRPSHPGSTSYRWSMQGLTMEDSSTV